MLKPGGLYIFVGMVHPHSRLDITGEQIIRKCLTIKGERSFDEGVRVRENVVSTALF